jgi:uncharacterized phage protein gp47/JayE
MGYGVTKYGFVMKRGDQVLQDLKNSVQSLFPSLDLSDQTPEGQIIGVISKPIADLWEVANGDYNAQYPNSAEGQSLDNVCELNAITRLGASPDRAVLALNGDEGTVVDTTFQVQTVDKAATFQAQETVTISVLNTNKMLLEIATIADNATYIITINQHTVSINSGVGATAESISILMVDEINALTDLTLTNAVLPLTPDGTFTVLSNDTDNAFIAYPDSNFTINDFWTPILTLATVNGAISAPTNTITQIVTPVFGLESVTNLKDASLGREIEDDTPLRVRRYASIRIVGAATIEAIKSRILQQVAGVTQCKVYENVEDVTDVDGLLPHSLLALVVGGNDLDIANKIWETRSAGIQTNGNISTIIYDSMNEPHNIKFSRPTNDYIWLRITLTVFPSTFPSNGVAAMTDAILQQSENFGIGDEVLIQSFYCPIYSIPGVESALIEMAMTTDLTPPLVYGTTNIAIGKQEASIFDSSRIEIIIP